MSNSSNSKPSGTKEDIIPVIAVNGVYFPTQKLRIKLNDSSFNF